MATQTASELFESPAPAYSNLTVRRAFIVWLHCGQTNKFREVCNYFHVLEQLEERLPPERRALSRHHEYNLFINPPPSSTYLQTHHPALYSSIQLNDYYISKVEAIKNDKCVFKLDGFKNFSAKDCTTRKQIIDTSKLIRSYCISHNITLENFLAEFKQFARKCNIPSNVHNVGMYIQKQLVKDEMVLVTNLPDNFSFLDENEDFVEEPKVNDLTNQKKLLCSIDVYPVLLKEIKDNPWRVDSIDLLNCTKFKMNDKKEYVSKQYHRQTRVI